MSNLVKNTFIVLLTCLPFSLSAQTAYESDSVDYFVSSNVANDSLTDVNFVICMMSSMGGAEMVNRGPYKISLYADDCETADTSKGDAAAAKPKSAKSAQSTKKSDSGATGSTAKTVTVAYADVTRADTASPQIMKAWVEMVGQLDPNLAEYSTAAMLASMPNGGRDPDILVYLENTTTAAPSATSQFGVFDMKMSFALKNNMDMCGEGDLSTEQKIQAGCLMIAGTTVGGGRITASGSSVNYVEYQMQEPPLRTSLTYSGDKIEGLTVVETGFSSGAPNYEWTQMEQVTAFTIDNGDAAIYCSKVISAGVLDFEDWSDDGGYQMPKVNAVSLPYAAAGLTADETCYSLKESEAQKNIHRYGVYNVDGTRAALTGVPAFPMNTKVTVDSEEVELFGWADYYNIHVDDWNLPAGSWDSSTVFTKEQMAGETGPALQIKIDSSNQRVTKYTKSYLSLADLDKLSMVSWINGSDYDWGSAYQSLGFPATEREYEGTYNKANQTWSFSKSINWASGWSETTLATPITFTNAEYVSAMSITNEDSYTQDLPDKNGLQINTYRFKITDYLQGATLSATASENVQYWWIGGNGGGTFGGYPWGKDTGDSPGIDLENLQGLINGTANARPLKMKGYFGNLPNSGSGTTTVTVTLTQGDDTSRSGTEDQISGSVPVAWTSNGTTMTGTVAAGTTLSGIYNDGGSAVNFTMSVANTYSKTVTLNSEGNAVFELILGDGLKMVKAAAGSFASFFSDGQKVNMVVDFGALPVYTADDSSTVADKFAVTIDVKSSPGVNGADAWTQDRGFWAWSPDSGKGYDIGIATFQNPTDSGTTNGIQVETREELNPSNYPAKFKCVFNCTTAATINATANAAKALNGNYGNVVSPHLPNTVQYIKSGDRQNQYFPGVLATDVVTYTPNGLVINDATNTAMGFAASITENDVSTAGFLSNPGDSYTQELQWGIRTGRLLGGSDAEIATALAKLECARSDNTKVLSDTNKYREVHPTFSANATRYCNDAYWEGNGPTVWYELEFGASEWQKKKYAKDTATGAYVNFARPETLYYAVPNDTTAYPEDAGKSVRLDFGGFGDLWGIPGQVINVTTGAVLGEFYNGEWSENLRYVQRFAMEPYNGVAPVLTSKSSDKTYKVKALQGEQWLALKASAKGTQTYTKTGDDLPKLATISLIGPKLMNGDANTSSIGAVPALSTLFNSGKPSVIHGDLAVTLD